MHTVFGVHLASVDKIVTLFMDRSLPNLEHSFSVSYRRKVFLTRSIQSSIRACATINRLSLTACVVTACAIILYVRRLHTFQVSNANQVKFLCVLKFCVLNINVSLQFADTIIVNG